MVKEPFGDNILSYYFNSNNNNNTRILLYTRNKGRWQNLPSGA